MAALKGGGEVERVVHGVYEVHAVGGAQRVGSGESVDGWTNRSGTRVDNERVVAERVRAAVGITDAQLAAAWGDVSGVGVGADRQAGVVEVLAGSVREVAPVTDVTADVVRDAADAEVG